MKRSRKNKSKKGISASAETSSQDALLDKFAKLRLEPSQGRISKKSKSKKKKANNKKRNSPNISSKGKFSKRSGSRSHAHDTEVVHPVLPYCIYKCIEVAAEIMNRPGWCNEAKNLSDLEEIEHVIHAYSRIFESHLPTTWEYKRKYASSLIAGYDRIFEEDGILHII
ncbi:hypothetical protein QVD17_36568 [Tagetes erecta]|uniref:Uncharacterized protein n=1 Tax=Tagetes erecta TaxID=13708 RepID=A0AAD8JYT8_TARER|nr:hypothetical protein QVD17_36568 [Tagetes erecta]